MRRLLSLIAVWSVLFAGLATPTLASAAAPTLCANQICPVITGTLVDQGGDLITAPQVYAVAFSTATGSLAPSTGFVVAPSSPVLPALVNAALSGPYAQWWMSEYSRPGQAITAGTFAGVVTLANPTLATATQISNDQIANALDAASQAGQLSVGPNSIFVVLLRAHQVVVTATGASTDTFCAYHASVTYSNASQSPIVYAVMPDQSVADNPGSAHAAACALAGPTATATQDFSTTLAHELVESVTDPASPRAWSSAAGDELADICENNTAPVPVTTPAGTLYLPYVYSLAANGCYAGPVTPNLVGTLANGNLTITLDSSAGLLAGQTLTVGSSTVVTGPTGTVTLPAPNAAETVTFAGAGPLAPAAIDLAGAGETLNLTVNPMAPGSSTATATVATTPATAGQILQLQDPRTGAALTTITTGADGRATFAFTPTSADQWLVAVTFESPVVESPLAHLALAATTRLAASLTRTRRVLVQLRTNGPSVAGLPVYLEGHNGLVTSAVTSSRGTASIALPPSYSGALQVRFPGTSTLAPAEVTLRVPALVRLSLTNPAMVGPGVLALTVTTAPRTAHLRVRVRAGACTTTVVTAANGTARAACRVTFGVVRTTASAAVSGATTSVTRILTISKG